MHASSDTQEDFAAGLVPPPQSRMPWRVLAVHVLPQYRLRVHFRDGLSGEVDVSQLVHSDKAGVFSVLKDIHIFNQAYVDCGAVTWPGEIDLAPDAMYQAIKENGHWLVEP